MSKKNKQAKLAEKPPGILTLGLLREATKDLPDCTVVRGYEGEVSGVSFDGKEGFFLTNRGERLK
jgi:hypothetical protein